MSPLESCALLRFQALVTWEFPAGWKVLNMEMQTKPWAPLHGSSFPPLCDKVHCPFINLCQYSFTARKLTNPLTFPVKR